MIFPEWEKCGQERNRVCAPARRFFNKTMKIKLHSLFIGLALLGGVTEVADGHFQFTDPQATNYARRFYRVHSP